MTPETPVIYVDSASSDESVAIARGAGCMVHELDASRPLSAARARNEGLDRLLASHPRLELIQFVDGDCEILPGWIEAARRELEAMPQVVIVCGRVRERSRARSIYSRLCDIDANRPPGETTSCGGLFMTRMAQFREVGGFEPSVVAGEEAELCLRLRR
ncbi:MAG: glycosyltransferase family A protein, partial [Dehalococcoidia bacterium]